MSLVRQIKKMATAILAAWRRFMRSRARSMSGTKQARKMATAIFNSIDVDVLRDRIEPAEGGTKLGKNNQPSPDARILSSVEDSIIHKVELSKNRNHQILLDHLAWQHKRLSYEPQIDRGKRIETNFNFLIERNMGHIRTSRIKKEEIEKHFEDFKKDNNLKRPPYYPEIKMKFVYYAVLVVICVFETMMNSFFLARGNEFGILGAYMDSFLITLLNVGVPVILVVTGLFGNMLHVNPVRKLIGWLVSAVYLLIIFFVNLGVAHYREISGQVFRESGPDQPLEALVESLARVGNDAWIAMSSGPFGFQELQTWGLFLMGIIFSLIALFDALKLDDLYPGYGAYHRRLEKTGKLYDTDSMNLVMALQEKLKEGNDEIELMDGEAKNLRVERQHILTTRDHLFSSFILVVEQLQAAAKILIGEFREENLAARMDDKTPAYFKEHHWEIQTPEIDRELPNTMISNDQIEKTIQGNKEKLEIIFQDMKKKFNFVLTELELSRDVERT